MNFDYTDEERAVAEQARIVLSKECPPGMVRALLNGEGTAAADALWRVMVDLGWPAVAIPEAYGGLGLGHVALCALAEELGRAVAPVPMIASVYLAAEALLLAGSEAQKLAMLPLIAAGKEIWTAALVPENGVIRLQAGRLHGVAALAPHGDVADVAIVRAVTGTGEALCIVRLDSPPITRTRLSTLDDGLPQARLVFDGAPAEILGDGVVPATVLHHAAVLIAFQQLGGAEACLEMATGFARERKTFGRAIAGYQAIKHRLADIYVANQLARANCYYAAWALTSGAPELALAAATARVSATEAYEFAAGENIQIHGGIGFTWEADCHLHYRRSRMLAHAVGTLSFWQDLLADALEQRQAA